MAVLVKPMETEDELARKAYVHWKAWHEAYRELIPADCLDGFTLDPLYGDRPKVAGQSPCGKGRGPGDRILRIRRVS